MLREISEERIIADIMYKAVQTLFGEIADSKPHLNMEEVRYCFAKAVELEKPPHGNAATSQGNGKCNYRSIVAQKQK